MKYRLTNETIRLGCRILHRIECVETFADVEVGDKGGWIGEEGNLSQEDGAWVYGNAKVYGNALVYDYAVVYDSAQIYDCAVVNGYAVATGDAKISQGSDYIVFKNNFSSGRYFTWTRSNNMWAVGCFYGTGEELIEKARQDSEEKAKCYALYVKLVEDLQKVKL